MFDFPYPNREEPCIFHKLLHYFSSGVALI